MEQSYNVITFFFLTISQGWESQWDAPPPSSTPSTFLHSKKKKGKQRKKERVSKQKLLKSCHQGKSLTVLAILEHLEFRNFSCQPTIFSVPWPLLFEIHFDSPVSNKTMLLSF